MVDTIRTVNTDNADSPDYTSLAAWQAGEQGTIGAGDRHIVRCSGIAPDTTTVNISGWSVADPGALIVEGDPNRADGWYKGNEDWSTQHYRMEHVAAGSLRIDSANVHVRNIQCRKHGGVAGVEVLFRNHWGRAEGLRIRQETADIGLNFRWNYNDYSAVNCIIDGFGVATQGLFTEGSHDNFLECNNNVIKRCLVGHEIAGNSNHEEYFNNAFIDCVDDMNIAATDPFIAFGNNATSKGTSDDTEITVVGISTPADYVSATDHRSVDQGKLDLDGSAAHLPATDITGVPFVNANISPFNEIFGAGPAPAGYSYGYMVG